MPLDLSYPISQPDYMIEDAGIEVILSYKGPQHIFEQVAVIDLDTIDRAVVEYAPAISPYSRMISRLLI
ncbi:hypothetical protein [Thalassomonas actiniarum]|uniref:Uncharacterized protein n=1 Tax=Thalassomonas actiniarum TaxID=485447 RepID=A0AAE9YWA5_9GAMM|nr:hypothetical protein [Thalassomonas actiniarum]WDE02350.1 hypothetical protein SG35_031870 [Thalassomonas actiniarum]